MHIVSLGLPLGSPFGISHGDPLGYHIEYSNTEAELGSLVVSIYGKILGNPHGSLPGSSVDM